MSQRNNSADNELLVSRSAAWERFRDSVRMFVGRGKRYSVKQVSNGTGISDRMIECFMARTDSSDWRKPDIEELLSLASFLGPDFTSEVIGLASQAALWLPDTDDLPPGALAADTAEDSAAVVRAAMDGKFQPSERKDLKIAGQRMMSNGAKLVALGMAA